MKKHIRATTNENEENQNEKDGQDIS